MNASTDETTPKTSPETPHDDGGSFLGNLVNIYFEPAATFPKIFVRPAILAVLLIQTALSLGFTQVWLSRLDATEFMKRQLEANSRVQQMSAEQVQAILDQQVAMLGSNWMRVGPTVGPAMFDLVCSGLLFFVFAFFFGAEVTFKRSFIVVIRSYVAMGLIQTPLMLGVMALKGDWNVDPNQVLQANPTLFVEQTSVAPWLFSLLASFDLFTFWTIFLLASGFAAAGRLSLSTALWGVGIPWGIYVMGKVAFNLVLG